MKAVKHSGAALGKAPLPTTVPGTRVWTETELRWYLDDPTYKTDAWWKPSGPGSEGISYDDKNEMLVVVTRSGKSPRTGIRQEPILWEILRRHPDLPAIRAEFQAAAVLPSPILVIRSNASTPIITSPWDGRGREVIVMLVSEGHRTWVGLDDELRERFSAALPEFIAADENFPSGVRPRGLKGPASSRGIGISSPFVVPRPGVETIVIRFDPTLSDEGHISILKEHLRDLREPTGRFDGLPNNGTSSSCQAGWMHLDGRMLDHLARLDDDSEPLGRMKLKQVIDLFKKFEIRNLRSKIEELPGSSFVCRDLERVG